MVDRKFKKIGFILAPDKKVKNIKILYFLQLLKFEKKSSLRFVHFENEELAKSQPLGKN